MIGVGDRRAGLRDACLLQLPLLFVRNISCWQEDEGRGKRDRGLCPYQE